MKYVNDGEFKTEIINEILSVFFEEEPEKCSKNSYFDTEFLDFVLYVANDSATKKPVKTFLENCESQRVKQGYYNYFQAMCLLKTYCHIVQEKQKANYYNRRIT
jgi:hypothetical protein